MKTPMTKRQKAVDPLSDPEKSGFYRAERLLLAAVASIEEHFPAATAEDKTRMAVGLLLAAAPHATGGL